MCGIIAAFNGEKKPVNEWVIDTYEEQFGRGVKGFGVVTLDNNSKVKVMRATEPVKALVDLNLNPSNMIVMHHRYPTSTENYLDQTHPISVSDESLKYDYLVVHNGVLINDKELKVEHEKLGFVYNTPYITNTWKKEVFNDSEAFAVEIARFIEGQIFEVGTQGSAAFVALQVSKDKESNGKAVKVFFGRNEGSPLNLSASKNKIRISSEGEGDEVKPFMLYSFAPGKFKIEKKKMCFKSKPTPVVTSTPSIGFQSNIAFDPKDNGVIANRALDKFSEDYESEYGYKSITSDLDNLESAGEKSSLKKIADDCREKVCTALEEFLDEIKTGTIYGAADTQKMITDAIKEAEDATEEVCYASGSYTSLGEPINSNEE